MFERLAIPDVFVFTPARLADARGFFSETFNRALLEPMTGPLDWVQDNHSLSHARGTLRGLHFQTPPFAQDKLVRCTSGAVLDVALDIRHGSPTFGQHVTARLTAERGEQIFIPKGFAHGFVTLTDACEVAYKVSAYYSGAHDRGVAWDDPSLDIGWGFSRGEVTLSAKDAALPALADLPVHFRFGE